MATVNLLYAASLTLPDSTKLWHQTIYVRQTGVHSSLELRLTTDSPAVTKYLSETLRYLSGGQQQQGWLCLVLQ